MTLSPSAGLRAGDASDARPKPHVKQDSTIERAASQDDLREPKQAKSYFESRISFCRLNLIWVESGHSVRRPATPSKGKNAS